MKKLIIILIAVPFILSSCNRDPYADFFVSMSVVDVGEAVYFTNNSIDADDFEWDFGDGTGTYSFDASHIYTEHGTFTVKLFAYNGNRVSRATATVTVLFPTTLDIIVKEYWDEYLVEGASVLLYPTLTDWNEQENDEGEAFTNQYGWTSFSNLNTQRYYVDVWEDNHDNYTLAAEENGIVWIETHVLYPNEINEFVAYVDYYTDGKKSGTLRDRNRRIVKLEYVGHRKFEDKQASIEESIRKHKEQRASQMELLGK